jgi:hypothetical protein
MRTGRFMLAARYTTVEMRRLAMYRADRNRCWTSSTDWNMGLLVGDWTELRFRL